MSVKVLVTDGCRPGSRGRSKYATAADSANDDKATNRSQLYRSPQRRMFRSIAVARSVSSSLPSLGATRSGSIFGTGSQLGHGVSSAGSLDRRLGLIHRLRKRPMIAPEQRSKAGTAGFGVHGVERIQLIA